MPDSTQIAHGASADAHSEHPPYLRHHFESTEQQADAAGFAMWLFLLTEVMFFGGLFTAYLIYRNWYYPAFVAASHQLNVFWGTLNTVVLISSSFTMAMGVWCAETRRKSGLVLCLILTFIMGLGFLGIKSIEYREKIEKHHVPGFHYSMQSFLDPASDPEVFKEYHDKPLAPDMAVHTALLLALLPHDWHACAAHDHRYWHFGIHDLPRSGGCIHLGTHHVCHELRSLLALC
jgi:cytochrome c oxidase subunit 3